MDILKNVSEFIKIKLASVKIPVIICQVSIKLILQKKKKKEIQVNKNSEQNYQAKFKIVYEEKFVPYFGGWNKDTQITLIMFLHWVFVFAWIKLLGVYM